MFKTRGEGRRKGYSIISEESGAKEKEKKPPPPQTKNKELDRPGLLHLDKVGRGGGRLALGWTPGNEPDRMENVECDHGDELQEVEREGCSSDADRREREKVREGVWGRTIMAPSRTSKRVWFSMIGPERRRVDDLGSKRGPEGE